MLSFVRNIASSISMMIAGCLLLGAAPNPGVAGQAASSSVYPIKFSLIYDDRTLGTPTLNIREGSSAMIIVERRGGYALRTTLGRKVMNSRVLANLEIEIYRESGGKWQKVATPQLMMPFGGKSSFMLDRPTGGQPIMRLEAAMGTPLAAISGKPNTCTAAKLENWQKTMKAPVQFQKAALMSVAAQDIPPFPGSGGGCCSGACFRCCGDAARCADPHNCEGSCCTY